MTRYKGRMSPKAIEREFPHVVEIAVPPGGLGAQLDAMHYFRRARGIEACLGLGLRVRRIVLLPFDVGFNVGRRHQPHRVAERLKLPRPMMR